MKTPRHQIARVVADSGFSARPLAAYLLDTGRTGELNSLLRDIQQERIERGTVEVVAVSAFELSEAARRDITERIRQLYPEAERIIVSERRDPGIVAGVRLELPHQQLDLSVRGKLDRFKQLTMAGARA